jgi:uncharacterized membrane protein YuzA (DUF378 family)
MLKLNTIGWVALVLVMIGALNWGLVGIFNGYNLVSELFGPMSTLSRIVYILVGISALYLLMEIVVTFRFRWYESHRPHPA